MGKIPLEKQQWKLHNKREKFNQSQLKKDRRALQQFKKLKKNTALNEKTEKANFTDNSVILDQELFIPRALSKKKELIEQENKEKQPASNVIVADSLNDSNNDKGTSKEEGQLVDESKKSWQKVSKKKNASSGLMLRFKKELQTAAKLKVEKERQKQNKEEAIQERMKAIKCYAHEREERCRVWKQRTKRGQLKMDQIISNLTRTIEKNKQQR